MKPGDCPFCHIAAGENDTEVVYQDELITAFWDRHPGAPVHILIIPNQHYNSLNDVDSEDSDLLGRMMLKARELAVEFHIDQGGYRVFMNTGADGGQTVFHMHLHLMGGKPMGIYRV
jgi:histidine triad (HIT) family protein